ncbi:MAG: hypothetical protein LBI29_04215 [Rickettsiales bacterium]|jgi:predicted outer membrane repeat protein|nr:hypothetical protein [Rickettsiales bacterium]
MFSFLENIYSFNKDYSSLKSKTKVSGRHLIGICLLLLWFGSGAAGASSITKISGEQNTKLVISDGQTIENEGSVSFKNIRSMGQKGGAIFVSSGGTLNLDSGNGGSEGAIVFQGNSAAYGGAISVDADAMAVLRGTVRFEDNTAPTYYYGGAIFVGSGGTLNLDSGNGGSEGAIVFQGNFAKSGGAIYVKENAMAILRGTVRFEDNTAPTPYYGGAIYNDGTLNFILGASDHVIFSNASTQSAYSNYNGIRNQGDMAIEGVSGSLFRLGRVLVEGTGKFLIKGGLELSLFGKILQKTITFEDNPTLQLMVWSWDNIGQMSISSKGTIAGSANITVAMVEDVEHFFGDKQFDYLEYVAGVNVDSFQPTLDQDMIEHGRAEYGVSLGNSSLSREIVLQGYADLTGNVSERFIVGEGQTRKIYDANFENIDNGAVDGSGGALEIEAGATALLWGSIAFRNNIGGVGAIKISENGTLRIYLENVDDLVEFENNRIGSAEGDLLDISNGGKIVVEKGTVRFPDGGIAGDGTLVLGNSSVLSLDGSATVNFGDGAGLILNIGSFDSTIDDADDDRATRGGSGGILNVQGGGSLVGSPEIGTIPSQNLLEELFNLATGTTRQYKYLYASLSDLADFTPRLSREIELLSHNGEELRVRTSFLDTETGTPDYRVIGFKCLPKVISGEQRFRLEIPDGQTVENEGSVSFRNISSPGRNGGAISVESGGTLNLDSEAVGPEGTIVFQNNYAGSRGGAIYVGSNAAATIRGNIKFENNTAPYNDGGAIYVGSGGTLEFDSGSEGTILFKGNSDYRSGAIYVSSNATATLKGNIKFFKNTIRNKGTLEFILETGNQIEFQNTEFYDIYDDGAMHLNCVAGGVIKFSRGIGIMSFLDYDYPTEEP